MFTCENDTCKGLSLQANEPSYLLPSYPLAALHLHGKRFRQPECMALVSLLPASPLPRATDVQKREALAPTSGSMGPSTETLNKIFVLHVTSRGLGARKLHSTKPCRNPSFYLVAPPNWKAPLSGWYKVPRPPSSRTKERDKDEFARNVYVFVPFFPLVGTLSHDHI